MKLIKVIVLVVLAWNLQSELVAQEIPKISARQPYYIDITTASQNIVYDIQGGNLDVQYMDNVGQSKEIVLKVFNARMELNGIFRLDKVLGLNHYTVDLDAMGIELETDAIFHCELVDEISNKYNWSIRATDKPEVQGPKAGIFVSPKSMPCASKEETSVETNLIEFFGEITLGKAPYIVNWYVLNSNRTELLYQPKEEIIDSPDKTPMIIVDREPSYYVVMQVADACSNTDSKVVLISCENDQKRINTVFVGPLNEWIKTTSPVNNKSNEN